MKRRRSKLAIGCAVGGAVLLLVAAGWYGVEATRPTGFGELESKALAAASGEARIAAERWRLENGGEPPHSFDDIVPRLMAPPVEDVEGILWSFERVPPQMEEQMLVVCRFERWPGSSSHVICTVDAWFGDARFFDDLAGAVLGGRSTAEAAAD